VSVLRLPRRGARYLITARYEPEPGGLLINATLSFKSDNSSPSEIASTPHKGWLRKTAKTFATLKITRDLTAHLRLFGGRLPTTAASSLRSWPVAATALIISPEMSMLC